VRLTDAVGRVEAWMPLDQLRVRTEQPLRFANDTLVVGMSDFRVVEVAQDGVRLAPWDLPDWILPESRLAAPVACADLNLVTSWRGDLRAVAVGSSKRGDRVYLSTGGPIEVSHTPGTASSLVLRPETSMAVERLSRDVEATRVALSFRGGMVVGWVPKEALLDEPDEGASVTAAAQAEEAGEQEEESVSDSIVACKRELPLWATAQAEDYSFGALEAGAYLVLGERQRDKIPVLAIPGLTTWSPVQGVELWGYAKAAKGCKEVK